MCICRRRGEGVDVICKLRFSSLNRAITLFLHLPPSSSSSPPTMICAWLIVNNSRRGCGVIRADYAFLVRAYEVTNARPLRLTQSRRNWTITSVRGNARLGSRRIRWSMFYDPNDLRSNKSSVLFWLENCAMTANGDDNQRRRAYLLYDIARYCSFIPLYIRIELSIIFLGSQMHKCVYTLRKRKKKKRNFAILFYCKSTRK